MTIDFADVKPGLLNWTIIGMMAVTFITFWKYITAMFPFPLGISDLFASI